MYSLADLWWSAWDPSDATDGHQIAWPSPAFTLHTIRMHCMQKANGGMDVADKVNITGLPITSTQAAGPTAGEKVSMVDKPFSASVQGRAHTAYTPPNGNRLIN